MYHEEHADIIVVGAGTIGASTALHLLEEGAKDVVLIDKDPPGLGTSNAGAGFVGPLAVGWAEGWGEPELAVEYYGMDFYEKLAESHDIDFRRSGHLYVARDHNAWDQLRGFVESDGVPDRRVVEPNEITRLTEGLVDGRHLFRGLLQPSAVQLSAGKGARALAAEFVRRGGRLEARRPVTGLLLDGNQLIGVETARGPIRATQVAFAAGAWTNQLVQPHTFIPQTPLVLSRMITEPLGVPPTIPAMNFAGYSDDGRGILWIREDSGRLNWGMSYTSHPSDVFVDEPVTDRFDHLPLDGVFEVRRAARRLVEAVPRLLTESYSVTHGAPCLTADSRALIGKLSDLQGAYVVGGCNGVGVQHGPGWGKVAAELIMRGRSTLADASVWEPNRFGDQYKSAREVHDDLVPSRRPVKHI
ncbi:NAD(P)/FAD-dependent oxidoreductase [Actinomadura sp. 6N118]|uniref:NAD(P)/FAD-dependent oxidoreductase n=1 Tax=Actinomadura sp. 6N118 TaxID=3375151 RepID=UPI0037B4B5F5